MFHQHYQLELAVTLLQNRLLKKASPKKQFLLQAGPQPRGLESKSRTQKPVGLAINLHTSYSEKSAHVHTHITHYHMPTKASP